MDINTWRDRVLEEALATCGSDLDTIVELISPVKSRRRSSESSLVVWGAPPRFVSEAPGRSESEID